jgi:SNF2 family DNA or RNA helicase
MVHAVGNRKTRLAALRLAWNQQAQVVVMNYDALRSTPETNLVPWRVVVLDEATKVKSPQAKISKLAQKLCAAPERVYGMSGCPTPNGLQEWWSQMQAVAPGVLEPSYYAFRNKRFYQPRAHLTWLWKPRDGAQDRLVHDLSSHVSWLRKEQCLDLPPVTHEIRDVRLSPKEREAYDTFIRDWLLEFEEGEVVGITALTELMKCRQMTAGLVKLADVPGVGGKWKEIGDSKATEVLALVAEIGPRPIMVIGQFRYELERLCRSLRKAKRRPCLLYGSMTRADRTSSIEGFQEGDFDVLLGHPKSMGHGLTFVNCSDMIFASHDYSYENFYQVMQRIHRIGQHKPCTYYHLVAKDTVDVDILNALRKKRSLTLDMIERFKHAART